MNKLSADIELSIECPICGVVDSHYFDGLSSGVNEFDDDIVCSGCQEPLNLMTRFVVEGEFDVVPSVGEDENEKEDSK